jgi:hypothetical protein
LTTRGIIADMFSAAERGAAMGVFAAAPFLGPAIGPVAGAFLAQAEGWKWVAALLAFFALFLFVLGALFSPETYAPVLLRRRAQYLSKATGKVYRAELDVKKPMKTKDLFLQQLKTPWILLFTETVAFLMAIYAAVVYAILYMQFTAFPIVFVQYRGWATNIAGLAFIGLSIGALLGLVFLGVFNKRYAAKLEAAGGFLPPEERLPPVIIGAILLPAGLFMFAWTCAPATIHWIVPCIATVIFGTAITGLFLGIMSYLVDVYLIYAASALAGNTVVRSLFGVILPLFVSNMYTNLGVNWAGTTVAFIALAFLPAPIIFYIYGPRIRRTTKFAREADDLNKMLAAKVLAARGTPKDVEAGPDSPEVDEADERTVHAVQEALEEAANQQVSQGMGDKMMEVERVITRNSLRRQSTAASLRGRSHAKHAQSRDSSAAAVQAAPHVEHVQSVSAVQDAPRAEHAETHNPSVVSGVSGVQQPRAAGPVIDGNRDPTVTSTSGEGGDGAVGGAGSADAPFNLGRPVA